MTLNKLPIGDSAYILSVNGSAGIRKRLLDLGFVKGQKITAVADSPLKDPRKYLIMNYEISLRNSEASDIEITYDSNDLIDANEVMEVNYLVENRDQRSESSNDLHSPRINNADKKKIINVAMVGNPNTGKTTLFNFVSGAHEHVGNYSGVTISSKHGKFYHKEYLINIIDLPGTYSLSEYSKEEVYVKDLLLNSPPDVVVNVTSASILERSLFLTSELMDMGIPLVMALNMYDELKSGKGSVKYKHISEVLGMRVIPTNSRTGKGVDKLLDAIIEEYSNPREPKKYFQYGRVAENSIKRLSEELKKLKGLNQKSVRYLAIKLLEGDKSILPFIKGIEDNDDLKFRIEKEQKYVERLRKTDIGSLLVNTRYREIKNVLKDSVRLPIFPKITKVIDNLLLNKVLAFPIFFSLMALTFLMTFKIGAFPQAWLENLFDFLSKVVNDNLPAGVIQDLISVGILKGVCQVAVFIPQIIILFTFISLFEESGYMIRAAFIMDKLMSKIGLHGKAFIPLMMGFGCNVPAIMSTRTIENRSIRMTTILINPFMSCTARLPVYVLLCGTFFPKNAAFAFFILYLIGIFLGVASALIFNKFLFKKEDVPFVMEFPPYRVPTLRSVSAQTWLRVKGYLQKISTTILIASLVIWALEYFPNGGRLEKERENSVAQIERQFDAKKIQEEVKNSTIEKIDNLYLQQRSSSSYLAKLGNFIEPVMRPLGFDWKISVSLLSGLAAKEVVISTMGIIYSGSEDESLLSKELMESKDADNQPVYTLPVIWSFLVFVLIYFPCIGTFAAIKGETGRWKWAIFQATYATTLAWVVALIVRHIVMLFT